MPRHPGRARAKARTLVRDPRVRAAAAHAIQAVRTSDAPAAATARRVIGDAAICDVIRVFVAIAQKPEVERVFREYTPEFLDAFQRLRGMDAEGVCNVLANFGGTTTHPPGPAVAAMLHLLDSL